jgi:hypothetical protein
MELTEAANFHGRQLLGFVEQGIHLEFTCKVFQSPVRYAFGGAVRYDLKNVVEINEVFPDRRNLKERLFI